MRYVGGKGKIAKGIRDAVLSESSGRSVYIEPFLGGAASFQELAPHFEVAMGGDAHPDLILMWNALVFDGWNPPQTYSEDEYRALRNTDPSPDRGMAGFGGSFGGKFFGGYARGGKNSDGTPRDHQNESIRSALKTRDILQASGNVKRFVNASYSEWVPESGSVIYCDPPYAGTQGYETGQFDQVAFWEKVSEWAMTCEVFVSGYAAPPIRARLVWQAEKAKSLATVAQGRSVVNEMVFKIERNA